VLHHVPDYLRIIDEFVRVLKPGGIIYIDHEVCPSYWEDKTEYLEYCLELSEVKKTQTDNKFKMLKELLSRKGCWRYIWATLSLNGKQIVDDGDIHVQKDDHIEWMAIREHLEPFCEIMEEEDYLVCRETHDPPLVWSRWRALCVDMRLFVARKR
jgi:ubiquinone/menaquinone biosynthesis C-methylase UbiE